ncbi:MAG: AAA family ATPase [Limnobacter sp.]|uniref:AAA family ATPase n=1 Tax=Limnobacter sp. TaxID=2003368 RepID=UPI003002856D
MNKQGQSGKSSFGELPFTRRAPLHQDPVVCNEYNYSHLCEILIPRNLQQELESRMQMLSKDKFIRQLNSLEFHNELHDFFESQRFEELKKKWSDSLTEHPSWVFQDDGEMKAHSQKTLKKPENLKVPDSTAQFLKYLKECMSDSKPYLKTYKGMARIFTARAISEFVEQIGEDRERIARSWRLFISMSQNNGFRKIITPNAPIEKRLQNLRSNFPNFVHVVDHVLRQMRIWSLKNSRERRLKPILLDGPKGTGKSAFARELAEALSTRYAYINISATSMGGVLTGMSNKWGNGQTGLIFSELARSETASPLILLDEIDKMSSFHQHPVEGPLLAALEPQTARELRDEYGSIEFDASRVIYVATSNNLNSVSAPLRSRFDVFDISYPDRSQRLIIIRSMLKKAYRNIDFTPQALSFLARQESDLRSLQSILDRVVACHVDLTLAQMGLGKGATLRGKQLIQELTVRIALEQTGIKAKFFDHVEV